MPLSTVSAYFEILDNTVVGTIDLLDHWPLVGQCPPEINLIPEQS